MNLNGIHFRLSMMTNEQSSDKNQWKFYSNQVVNGSDKTYILQCGQQCSQVSFFSIWPSLDFRIKEFSQSLYQKKHSMHIHQQMSIMLCQEMWMIPSQLILPNTSYHCSNLIPLGTTFTIYYISNILPPFFFRCHTRIWEKVGIRCGIMVWPLHALRA